jgi:hypothetical protein
MENSALFPIAKNTTYNDIMVGPDFTLPRRLRWHAVRKARLLYPVTVRVFTGQSQAFVGKSVETPDANCLVETW